MNKFKWDLQDAVVLYDFYFNLGHKFEVNEEYLKELSLLMKRKALMNGLQINDKYRNIAGLKMQIQCIRYVITDGKEGLHNASKIFYEAYDLYKNDIQEFNTLANDFYNKYYY